ncbi:MAG: hypothetical protein HYY78_17090 [Betaproteobacteria bacterium]|nr:hypothetical protein [Betaproteobacteria bacterium]
MGISVVGNGKPLGFEIEGVDLSKPFDDDTIKAIEDALAGHSVVFTGLPPALPYLGAKCVRPLAVTGAKRSRALAHVPTMTESGIRGYVVNLWLGLVAPRGAPAAIVRRLNARAQAMEQLPEITKRVSGMGLETAKSTPQ